MFQEVSNTTDSVSYEKTDFKFKSDVNQGQFVNNQMCPNICEAPRERVCHRYFCYDVPHIVPCNTRIINHHVYRHTYVPEYTYCEENECSNIYDSCPNNFF